MRRRITPQGWLWMVALAEAAGCGGLAETWLFEAVLAMLIERTLREVRGRL